MEAFEMMILDTEAEDYEISGETLKVTTSKSGFLPVRQAIVDAGYEILTAGLGYVAKNTIEITDFETALKIYKMLEEFDEDEDSETVWNNAEIADSLWKEVETFVESKKFRT
jgi:transcriptional/translational regulatory protein YebC/TACO1